MIQVTLYFPITSQIKFKFLNVNRNVFMTHLLLLALVQMIVPHRLHFSIIDFQSGGCEQIYS